LFANASIIAIAGHVLVLVGNFYARVVDWNLADQAFGPEVDSGSVMASMT
jgi:hypothetical protein